MIQFAVRQLKRVKVFFNFLLDRIVDFSNDILRGNYKVPAILSPLINPVANLTACLSLLLNTFPRISAYTISNSTWHIVYIGDEMGLKVAAHLFCQEEAVITSLPRLPLWHLGKFARQQLDAGADLVIIEHSPILKGFEGDISFSTPFWVEQSLSMPEDPESLISGNVHRALKGKIHRAERNGFQVRFSKELAELDYWYKRMYLPFVHGRHKDMALISTWDSMKRWFDQGGLLLVTDGQQPLAGLICKQVGDENDFLEQGVLDNDPVLWQQGINVYLIWSLIKWTHENHFQNLSMGYSHSWVSNGSFRMKSSWGCKVYPVLRVFPTWTIQVRELDQLKTSIVNEIGFISKHNKEFFRVVIRSPGQDDYSMLGKAELEHGLSGIMLIKPGDQTVFFRGNN